MNVARSVGQPSRSFCIGRVQPKAGQRRGMELRHYRGDSDMASVGAGVGVIERSAAVE